MTFYIQEKKTNKPIFEFKTHSFDIYPKYLDDDFEMTEDIRDEMCETNIIDKNTGELILIMKNTTIYYLNDDYIFIIE